MHKASKSSFGGWLDRKVLIVRGIAGHTDKALIHQQLMAKFGGYAKVIVPHVDPNSQSAKLMRTAYVNFGTEAEATQALHQHRNKLTIGGRPVELMFSIRDPADREFVFGPEGWRFTVMVQNISDEVEAYELVEHFEQVGEVFVGKIERNKMTGELFGIVQYVDENSVGVAISNLNNTRLLNTVIKVDRHHKIRQQEPAPRTSHTYKPTDFPALGGAPATAPSSGATAAPAAAAPAGPQSTEASGYGNPQGEEQYEDYGGYGGPDMPVPQAVETQGSAGGYGQEYYAADPYQQDAGGQYAPAQYQQDYSQGQYGAVQGNTGQYGAPPAAYGQYQEPAQQQQQQQYYGGAVGGQVPTAASGGSYFDTLRKLQNQSLSAAPPAPDVSQHAYHATAQPTNPLMPMPLPVPVPAAAAPAGPSSSSSGAVDAAAVRPSPKTAGGTAGGTSGAVVLRSVLTSAARELDKLEERMARNDVRVNAIKDLVCCPISHETMTDPVVAADGHTYERKAIEDWFQKQDSTESFRQYKMTLSPMTNEPLIHRMLVPNRVLKSIIDALA